AGVVNMMSLSTRFNESCRYLGQCRHDGVFGDIYYARARSVRRSGIPNWNLGFIQAGGGAFRDMGVHALDAVWWIIGMPRPVSVLGVAGAKFGPYGKGFWNYQVPDPEFYSKYDSDDYAGGFIRFENGLGLQIESFWASHQKEEFQIEIFGTEAGATYSPLQLFSTRHGMPHDTAVKIPSVAPSPWQNIADHFIEAILDGTPCQAPLRHGLIVQQMMEALLESARDGKAVDLEKRITWS
ncbi:MAG: gfo/Idh/MocA family oxidoreductase, partial [Lentisphaerae bacterium]